MIGAPLIGGFILKSDDNRWPACAYRLPLQSQMSAVVTMVVTFWRASDSFSSLFASRCPGVVARLAVLCDFCHTSEQRLCFLCSGCEKTFITVSALFSHNRAHFREQELFSCSFPGCSKQYDKACRLKIHLRSHTGNELENATSFAPTVCHCGSLHLW